MPKAKHEQLDDGWTRVSGKNASPAVPLHGLPPIANDATLPKLVSDFERKMKIWKASSCRKAVLKMLGRERPDDGWSFDKAICLASGSFTRDNFEMSRRSMSQFIVFIDIVKQVSENCANPIQMLAQDPIYTDLDEEFLSYNSITVLRGSHVAYDNLDSAKDHLGPRAMLFEFFMDIGPGRLQAICDADLQFYLGSSMQFWIERGKFDEDEVKNEYTRDGLSPAIIENSFKRQKERYGKQGNLAAAYLKTHRATFFPRFEEDPNSLEGLEFHWPEVNDDDGD